MSGTLRRGRDGRSSPQRLQANHPHSRASSSQSDASRSRRSKSDESEPASPTSEPSESLYTITSFLASRPKARTPSKKVQDEWAKVFSKWPEMRTQLVDQLVSTSYKENGEGMGRMAYLLKLSDPEQQNEWSHLEEFMKDEDGYIAVPIDESATDPSADQDLQQPRGWVDHQVWLKGWARPMTIPEQPGIILSPLKLEAALEPVSPTRIFEYHPDSIYRRIVYVGDPDPVAVTAVVKQATMSQSWALGELFRGYFKLSPDFRLQVKITPMPAKVANIVFHMPYLFLGKDERVDTRVVGGCRLRKTWQLSCLQVLSPDANWGPRIGKLYLNEGMMSVALHVRDDRWWGVTCLNDEFLLGNSRLQDETEESDDSTETQQPRVTQPSPAERSGLKHLDLEQVDPILDEAGVYTDQHPRVYMLTVLDTQLERFIHHHEKVYLAFKQAIKTYNESSLPRADIPRYFTNGERKAEIKAALDEGSTFLGILFGFVKQQEYEVNRFMKKDLGLDPTSKTTSFKNPWFVGLDKMSDPSAKDSAMRIMQSAGNLHTLRHGIEDLMDMVTKLRETVSRNIVEDLQVSQHEYAARGLRLGILVYISQAVMIPLALYNIPQAVTGLPYNTTGLVIVAFGLISLFMVVPLFLNPLFRLAVLLRAYVICYFCYWTQLRRSRFMKSRRD